MGKFINSLVKCSPSEPMVLPVIVSLSSFCRRHFARGWSTISQVLSLCFSIHNFSIIRVCTKLNSPLSPISIVLTLMFSFPQMAILIGSFGVSKCPRCEVCIYFYLHGCHVTDLIKRPYLSTIP